MHAAQRLTGPVQGTGDASYLAILHGKGVRAGRVTVSSGVAIKTTTRSFKIVITSATLYLWIFMVNFTVN